MGQNHSDNFQTPEWPLKALMSHLQEHSNILDVPYGSTNIWDPACGKRRIVDNLNKWGWTSYGSDIIQGYDFLEMEVINEVYSHIITNPPFSLKDKFLKRCYELEVPFALLLPIQAISSIKRSSMFKENGIQILVLPKRVDFEYEDGSFKGKPWFNCAWFTNRFDLPKDIDWL